mgnify:CR=1 FL=1
MPEDFIGVRYLFKLNVAALADEYLFRERQVHTRIEPPYALRLDGVNFGRCLEGFREPRDPVVHGALVAAAAQLVEWFNAAGAWVGSDEINLLLVDSPNPYGGRVEKLVSVSSGIASAIISLVLKRPLFFDSRVVPLKSSGDAALYILYRARVTANNFVNKLLQIHGITPRGGFSERYSVAETLVKSFGAWALLGTSLIWCWCTSRGRIRRRVVATAGPWALLSSLGFYVHD